MKTDTVVRGMSWCAAAGRAVVLGGFALATACSSSSGGGGSATASDGGGVDASPLDSNATCKATVTQGALAGKLAGATCEYLGIPYAKPPTGDLRFMPPQPADGWTSTRDATAFGASCPQSANGLGSVGTTNEDCLSVNVFTPQHAPGAALPVMVFIYGGAFTSGSSSLYDGSSLSEKGPVVLVTMNYRLGALGFLALPQLDAERTGSPSGSDGIRDQQLALQWVHDNIGRFNGDPADVTVFGESAGGTSTCMHIVSPGSQSLARRFIIESGLCVGLQPEVTTQANAYEVGQELAAAFCGPDGGAAEGGTGDGGTSTGVAEAGGDVLACLRAADATQLISWVPAAGSPAAMMSSLGNLLGPPFEPTVEGPGGVLPDTPSHLIASGNYNKDAEVLAGTNKDEFGLFVDLAKTASATTPLNVTSVVQLDQAITLFFPSAIVSQVEAAYPATDATAGQVFVDMMTDLLFRCPARTLASSLLAHGTKDAFLYSYEVGPAWHSFELVPLFDLTTLQLLGAASPSKAVTQDMLGYWTTFAASGNPNEPGDAGAPAWPAYATASDQYLEIVEPAPTTLANLRKTQCDFWAGFPGQ